MQVIHPFLWKKTMNDLKIYSVSDRYIDYLFSDPQLTKFIFDSKKNNRTHTRKYLGTVLEINGLSYFVPFSSPKPSDYIQNSDGSKTIRKSTMTIIRMTATNSRGEIELKGTLKLNNMIPVPVQELVYYDISAETDVAYKDLLQKEYAFIKANKTEIKKKSAVVYSQQCTRELLLAKEPQELTNKERRILESSPNYLNFTVPFAYVELKCKDFIHGQ